MFITRFNRLDNRTEDYYYYTKEEAESHMELFKDDDSGLYKNIEVMSADGDKEHQIMVLIF